MNDEPLDLSAESARELRGPELAVRGQEDAVNPSLPSADMREGSAPSSLSVQVVTQMALDMGIRAGP
jgi:hypothetical protein